MKFFICDTVVVHSQQTTKESKMKFFVYLWLGALSFTLVLLLFYGFLVKMKNEYSNKYLSPKAIKLGILKYLFENYNIEQGSLAKLVDFGFTFQEVRLLHEAQTLPSKKLWRKLCRKFGVKLVKTIRLCQISFGTQEIRELSELSPIAVGLTIRTLRTLHLMSKDTLSKKLNIRRDRWELFEKGVLLPTQAEWEAVCSRFPNISYQALQFQIKSERQYLLPAVSNSDRQGEEA